MPLSDAEGAAGGWYVVLMSWSRLACGAASEQNLAATVGAPAHLGKLPRLGHAVDNVEVAVVLVALDFARLLFGAPVDDERPALNLVHDLRGAVSVPLVTVLRRNTNLGEAAVDERLDAVVPDHVVRERDLDDLVLGDGRCNGVEQVGE